MNYEQLSSKIQGLTVKNTEGGDVVLESLWKDRQVVLAFLRHFGWMFARQQAAALNDMKKQLEGTGVEIVVIGSSTPAQAKTFAENFGFTGEVYVNEDLSAYKAFDLKRGFFRTLGIRSISRGFKVMGQGFRQGRHAGDLWQQGGIFVMGPGNRVAFQHVDRFAGDHADTATVVQSCSM